MWNDNYVRRDSRSHNSAYSIWQSIVNLSHRLHFRASKHLMACPSHVKTSGTVAWLQRKTSHHHFSTLHNPSSVTNQQQRRIANQTLLKTLQHSNPSIPTTSASLSHLHVIRSRLTFRQLRTLDFKMTCRLLELPVVVRNSIYQFTFSPEPSKRDKPEATGAGESLGSGEELADRDDNGRNIDSNGCVGEDSDRGEAASSGDNSVEGTNDDDTQESDDDDMAAFIDDGSVISTITDEADDVDDGCAYHPGSEEPEVPDDGPLLDWEDCEIAESQDEIDIEDQRGPHKSLLDTCSQIRGEARAAYDDAVKLFRGKDYRYCIHLDVEAVNSEHGHMRNLALNYGGCTADLPSARSLRVYFEMDESSFYLHFDVDRNGVCRVSRKYPDLLCVDLLTYVLCRIDTLRCWSQRLLRAAPDRSKEAGYLHPNIGSRSKLCGG